MSKTNEPSWLKRHYRLIRGRSRDALAELRTDLECIARWPIGPDGMPELGYIGNVDAWIDHWSAQLAQLEAELELIPGVPSMSDYGARLLRQADEAHRRLRSLRRAKLNDIGGSTLT
jgi:hypothetical protein